MVAFDVPLNADDSRLTMDHSYRLFNDVGGNVKVSEDDGRTWQVLEPEGAYPVN